MDDDQRAELEALAEHLDADEHGPRAQELKGEVRIAIDSGEHDTLRGRLREDAVAFENDHPELSAVILRAMELLGGAGL